MISTLKLLLEFLMHMSMSKHAVALYTRLPTRTKIRHSSNSLESFAVVRAPYCNFAWAIEMHLVYFNFLPFPCVWLVIMVACFSFSLIFPISAMFLSPINSDVAAVGIPPRRPRGPVVLESRGVVAKILQVITYRSRSRFAGMSVQLLLDFHRFGFEGLDSARGGMGAEG